VQFLCDINTSSYRVTLKTTRKTEIGSILLITAGEKCFFMLFDFMECIPDGNWDSAGAKNARSFPSVPPYIFFAQ
jgi:hypothetical protein